MPPMRDPAGPVGEREVPDLVVPVKFSDDFLLETDIGTSDANRLGRHKSAQQKFT